MSEVFFINSSGLNKRKGTVSFSSKLLHSEYKVYALILEDIQGISSFGTLGQLLKLPPLSAQKGRGVPNFVCFDWNHNIFIIPYDNPGISETRVQVSRPRLP